MNIALIATAALLALAAAGSAAGKFRRLPTIVASMHSVGVTDRQIPQLATLELLGAIGLLVGIQLKPIGVAAAAGLTLYFLGAVVAHLRTAAPKSELAPAAVLAALAFVTTLLEFGR